MKHCLLLASLFLTAASGAAEPPTEKTRVEERPRGSSSSPAARPSCSNPIAPKVRRCCLPGECDPSLASGLSGRERRKSEPAAAERILRRRRAPRYAGNGGAALHLACASRRRSSPCCARDRCARGRFRTSRVASRCRSARRVGAHRSGFPRIAVARPRDAKGILPVGYGTEYAIGNSGRLQARYPSCTGTMQPS